MKRFLAILIALAVFLPLCGYSATYYVAKYGNDSNDGLSWDAPKLDLQSLVQTIRTNTLTTVNIGAGTWQVTNNHITLYSNVYLKGTSRTDTVLMGTKSNRVIYTAFSNNWLDSLTITRGDVSPSSDSGGGVKAEYNDARRIHIENCTIVSNYSYSGGGGVINAYVNNSEISYNKTVRYGGGFSDCIGTNLFIHHNSSTNAGYGGGGGYGGSIRNSRIENNTAYGVGGGLYNVYVYDSSIISNSCSVYDGGGVFGGGGTNITVSYNTAARYCGGIFGAAVSNAVITYNSAPTYGGIFGDCRIYGSLIAFNVATANGGGSGPNTYVYNSVFASNRAANYPAGFNLYGIQNCTIVGHTNTTGILICTQSTVHPAWNNILWGNGLNAIGNSTNAGNNITNNPLFLPDSYKLQTNSPCIDAGNDTYAVGLEDYYGRSRIYGAMVDIGASEWHPEDIPVNSSGNGKKGALLKYWKIGKGK